MDMKDKKYLVNKWRLFREITDEKLLDAFMAIPRENFIGDAPVSDAYHDRPLHIGFGQTISQPTTVMLMLQLLELQESHTVLEIGGGSGYSAAIMSRLVKEVVSIERIPDLVTFAECNLKRSNIVNVTMLCSDGKLGHIDKAPYDRIVIAASTPEVPQALFQQLKQGGVLLAPVGEISCCVMTKYLKQGKGEFDISHHGYFSFVPLI